MSSGTVLVFWYFFFQFKREIRKTNAVHKKGKSEADNTKIQKHNLSFQVFTPTGRPRDLQNKNSKTPTVCPRHFQKKKMSNTKTKPIVPPLIFFSQLSWYTSHLVPPLIFFPKKRKMSNTATKSIFWSVLCLSLSSCLIFPKNEKCQTQKQNLSFGQFVGTNGNGTTSVSAVDGWYTYWVRFKYPICNILLFGATCTSLVQFTDSIQYFCDVKPVLDIILKTKGTEFGCGSYRDL